MSRLLESKDAAGLTCHQDVRHEVPALGAQL